jgi:hypothetical protein
MPSVDTVPCDRFMTALASNVFPSEESIFAFKNCETFPKRAIKGVSPLGAYQGVDGWQLYDKMKEFARQGVTEKDWGFCNLNQTFAYCDSYPQLIVVPKQLRPEDLV